jgi:hypothetical protein
VQKRLESEDIETGDLVLAKCKGKMSYFAEYVISVSMTHYEVKYLKTMAKSNNFVYGEDVCFLMKI